MRASRGLIALSAVPILIVAHDIALDNEPAVTAETFAAASVSVAADPIDFTTPIEPIDTFDPRDDKGTIEQVCFAYGRTKDDVKDARLLPGTQAASVFLRTVFTWAGRGTLGQCRELLRSTTNRNCDFQIYPTPGPAPDLPLHFYSDCWSNHAQGRASDFLVGDNVPGRVRIARGTALVEWLLATDAFGNKQARARRLGVEEIFFSNHCWTTAEPDDLEKSLYVELDECDVGHFDHVHLSFSVAGALGLTSGYGPATPSADCAGCSPAIRPRR